MRWLVALAVVAGCGSSSDDVTGPFTGQLKRYYIDSIEVPHDNTSALAFADDLDGDGAVENQFGNVTGVLAGTSDLSTNSADMVASGAIASFVDIQADGAIDSSVGVWFFAQGEQVPTVIGGTLDASGFVSNRTRDTKAPGTALVHLPIFTNADPLVLPLEAAELDLTPDGDGYTGLLRGGFVEETARAAAYTGLIQMFQDEPERHLVFSRGVDENHDGTVSREEVDVSVIHILVTADVDLFDGDKLAPHPGSTTNDCISVGFRFHLSPMPPTATPQNTCRDRVRDGDETDVDCGGSCQACWDGKQCSVAADCQSNACNGTCALATCTDGVRDAFESDADCGGPCSPCAVGLVCAGDADCASHNCDNGVSSLGHCQ